MNIYYLIAGILCFALGIVHSMLGEYLVFKDSREQGRWIPTKPSSQLKERHLRILWATWHMASLFGWCLGLIIIKIALAGNDNPELVNFMVQSMTVTMFLSSILVFVGTKASHPGWIVLLTIGILLILGS